MHLFAGIIFLLFATFGVIATPIPGRPSDHVQIESEKLQGLYYGFGKVNNIKKAAVASNLQTEQSIRVANFPEDPENRRILVESFNKDFLQHITTIRQNLEAMRTGKLQAIKINADHYETNGALAIVNLATKQATFGENFHHPQITDQDRANTFTHEKSHAFANTLDHFAKSDGRPLRPDEKEYVEHHTGYLHKDHASLASHSSVQNADSYKKLGELAVKQYYDHKEHPPAKP